MRTAVVNTAGTAASGGPGRCVSRMISGIDTTRSVAEGWLSMDKPTNWAKKRVIIRGDQQRATAHGYVDEVPEDWEILFRPHRPDKTAEQRGYWHVLLHEFADFLGEPMGRVKMTIKARVLGDHFIEDMDGRLYLDLPSSEKAMRDMYSRLIDYTLQWAAECGCYLPPPRWDK